MFDPEVEVYAMHFIVASWYIHVFLSSSSGDNVKVALTIRQLRTTFYSS